MSSSYGLTTLEESGLKAKQDPNSDAAEYSRCVVIGYLAENFYEDSWRRKALQILDHIDHAPGCNKGYDATGWLQFGLDNSARFNIHTHALIARHSAAHGKPDDIEPALHRLLDNRHANAVTGTLRGLALAAVDRVLDPALGEKVLIWTKPFLRYQDLPDKVWLRTVECHNAIMANRPLQTGDHALVLSQWRPRLR